MRILHIGKYYPPFYGGIENFMADLLQEQLQQGHEVAAIVHDHQLTSTWRMQSMTAGDANATLYRIPSYGTLLYAPISPAFGYYLQRVINDFRPDVLHMHVPNTSVFWGLFSHKVRDIPWVVHWHADVFGSKLGLNVAYTLYRPFETRLLRQSRAIISTSKPYLDSSLALKDWQGKCHVVPLGLATHEMECCVDMQQTKPYFKEKRFKVLSLGRLSYYKGHDVLLKAMQQLPTVQLLIVGRGEQQTHLQALIDQYALHDRVNLLGSQPEEVVTRLLTQCDCLCLSSIDRAEAFGMVLLEAMAMEKAVVATDIPGSGVGTVVEEGLTGKLVEPGNTAALVDAIKYLANNKKRCEKMGQLGAIRFRQHFQISKIAYQIEHVYQQVVT